MKITKVSKHSLIYIHIYISKGEKNCQEIRCLWEWAWEFHEYNAEEQHVRSYDGVKLYCMFIFKNRWIDRYCDLKIYQFIKTVYTSVNEESSLSNYIVPNTSRSWNFFFFSIFFLLHTLLPWMTNLRGGSIIYSEADTIDRLEH